MASASYLQRDGHDVTVIDRVAPGESCSFGNAGGLSPGAVAPVATPGILKQIPSWLADPMGPLAIRWSYLLPALPWLLRFVRASEPERVERIAKALRDLLGPVFESYDPIVRAAGAEDLIHRVGQLYAYGSEAAFQGDATGRELRRRNGVQFEVLERDQIRQMEPALAPIFVKAVHFGAHGHCADPLGLVQRLAARVAAAGGRILRDEVRDIEAGPAGGSVIVTSSGRHAADAVVVAAGAWSHRLAARLGDRVPLETQRGYHVTVADPGVAPRRNVMWAERKFVATPMAMGLRVAGTVEIAGLKAAPDYRRADVLLKQAAIMYPGLRTDAVTKWMGHRPCTPDTLPVIGPATRRAGVFYAFGHGHTGLSGASTTGKVIAEIVGGRPSSIDLAPFRADRF
ncbi:MAG: FAD-dependent oxidoreductase [Alphaproteobacteria bacterium]|nr:FAD-dependent oxidoreductase [Alphaproteobacteria bacterium]